MRTSTILLPAALLAALLAADVARADATDEERAAARALGTDGVKLALAGDCANAVDKLTRAEALVHAPTTAVPLARCDIQLGKIVAGTEILNRVIRESLPPNPPPSWVQAQKQAQPLLAAALPRIAKLRVHVDRDPGATGDVQVTVDGAPLPAVLLDTDSPTDPGAHHVVAAQQGYKSAEADVPLADGQSQTVTLRLERLAPVAAAPAATSPATGAATAPAATATVSEEGGPNRVPAYIVMGLGVAALAAGSIYGGLALGVKSTLDGTCPDKRCAPSSQTNIDTLHADAIVSTVGIAAGLVGIGVGAVLFATAHPSSPQTGHVQVTPWVGLGAGGVSGRFQ